MYNSQLCTLFKLSIFFLCNLHCLTQNKANCEVLISPVYLGVSIATLQPHCLYRRCLDKVGHVFAWEIFLEIGPKYYMKCFMLSLVANYQRTRSLSLKAGFWLCLDHFKGHQLKCSDFYQYPLTYFYFLTTKRTKKLVCYFGEFPTFKAFSFTQSQLQLPSQKKFFPYAAL